MKKHFLMALITFATSLAFAGGDSGGALHGISYEQQATESGSDQGAKLIRVGGDAGGHGRSPSPAPILWVSDTGDTRAYCSTQSLNQEQLEVYRRKMKEDAEASGLKAKFVGDCSNQKNEGWDI